MDSAKQNTETQSGFVNPDPSHWQSKFKDEWDTIENENKAIEFDSAHWVPLTYALTHAARKFEEKDLSNKELTTARPLIDALRKVQWPDSTLPFHTHAESDVRLHTSAPCGSAEYSYAYCFGRNRFKIYAGDIVGRGATDEEFARGLLSQMSKLSGVPEAIIAKAKEFTGVKDPASTAEDGAETFTEPA